MALHRRRSITVTVHSLECRPVYICEIYDGSLLVEHFSCRCSSD